METPDAQSESMAVITPSYAQDFDLCADLAQSVRRYARPDVEHHIIVPRSDLALFESLSSATTRIHSVDEYLPTGFRRLPWLNGWMNLRRPYPPVRGWIAQQIIKLSAVASLDVEIALLVDSDIVMVRPFSGADFLQNGRGAMFRLMDAITDQNLPRHVIWHQVAQRMLGIKDPKPAPYPDYIAWPCAWQPAVCRSLLAYMETIERNQPWQTTVGRELHFSEMILYGVYVDEVLDPDERRIARTAEMNCVTYGDQSPLDLEGFRRLLARVSARDVAVMVSAKSGTPTDIRRLAWAEWEPPETP